MNTILKLFLSMSCSGGLLILLLLLCRQMLRHKVSRQWQYYVWLIVILRLLLPFQPKITLFGEAWQAVDASLSRAAFSLRESLTDASALPAASDDQLDEDMQVVDSKTSHDAAADNYETHSQPTSVSADSRKADSQSSGTIADKHEADSQLPDTTADNREAGNQLPDTTAHNREAGNQLPDATADNRGADSQPPDTTADKQTSAATPVIPIIARFLLNVAFILKPHLWLIWLSIALLLLIRKLTVYQSFLRYLKAGAVPVSDTKLLDRLSVIAKETGTDKPVELWIHPLVSSPLLTGFFHPCIVLPGADMGEADFRHTALHELTHYRRRDMFYKWLVQITVCLHWFNPLVHVMSREITKACEFSCDEAVLKRIGASHAQDYGKTLLDAMAATGAIRENIGAVTLSENKQLLKERLDAIMAFKKKSMGIQILTGVLTLCIAASASLIGVYPVFAKTAKTANTQQTAANKKDTSSATESKKGTSSATESKKGTSSATGSKKGTSSATGSKKSAASKKAERYYKAGSLPLFQAVFSTLNEAEQKYWLNRIYADDEVAFFSIALQALDEDSPLITKFAKKAYKDDEAAFFSILADYMDVKTLKAWLNQAIDDGDLAFQSILYDKLELDDEKDAQEEKWAKQQMAEYKKYGVTMKGKNYYYKGKLIRIFLDRRNTFPAYTLNINPKGTVDIKVVRDKKDKIKKVSYMTKAEVKEILGEDAAYQNLDDLDALDSLDALDELDKLDALDQLDTLDELDALDELDTLDELDALDELDTLDELDALDELDNLDDLDDLNGLDDSKKTIIPVNISRIKNGSFIWLGTYKLSKGDRIYYNLSAKTGKHLAVGFAKPGQSNPSTTYMTISNRRTDGKLEIKSGAMKWGGILKSGSYRLFVHTEGGTVTKVKGSITIVKAK